MDESSCCSTFLPEFDVSVLNLGGSDGKGSACNVGDPCSIPGSGSSPGEGNGSPLQWFCLKNSMNREAWQFTVHGIARVRSDWATFTSIHFNSYVVIFHCYFNLHFPSGTDVKHLFIYYLPAVYFLMLCLLMSLTFFLNQVVHFIIEF